MKKVNVLKPIYHDMDVEGGVMVFIIDNEEFATNSLERLKESMEKVDPQSPIDMLRILLIQSKLMAGEIKELKIFTNE